jgi:2-dehydro-3-deoxyphosphooctonate aldolase (KDO 8-P synthase)
MNMISHILPNIKHVNSNNFFLIAGPCVIENESMPFEIASNIQNICNRLEIPFIFKASYRKANRSSLHSFTGIGDEKGLKVLENIKKGLQIPVLTDIHTAGEASLAASYVDILQIPAFLCRQTDLLIAAGQTGKAVNVKKGQFVSPEAMQFAVEKIRSTANDKVMLTERGTTFGYQDLIVILRLGKHAEKPMSG